MKQIIVNVSGLSVEEKQRVNEALAKVSGAYKLPVVHPATAWFFAPLSSGPTMIAWGWESIIDGLTHTHTSQQVLEMAGMATKRKVREDFDPKQPISVDVSGCTEEEKKEVQQAFFDIGIKWATVGAEFHYLDAKSYSNSAIDELCYGQLLYGVPRTHSISHQQFLAMVYEAEQQGHVHADLMAQYAEDAKTTDKPWELWEFLNPDGNWVVNPRNPVWVPNVEYRRKPKTHIVNGVEVPDLRFVPNEDEEYWFPHPSFVHLCAAATCGTYKSHYHRVSNSLCYEYTEAGKQAAILHAKAWLGIA